MELFDLYGNAHTTIRLSSVQAINAFTHAEANYHDPDKTMLETALDQDPACASLLYMLAYL